MNRYTHSPFRNEYSGYSCLTDIKRTTLHRTTLFHSEGGHTEWRVDLIPRIPPLVCQGLGLFSAGHQTEHYFFSLAGDMPELSLNCSENGTRLLEFLLQGDRPAYRKLFSPV